MLQNKSQIYILFFVGIIFAKTSNIGFSHNGTSADILVYANHVLQLLKSESPEEFEKKNMNCFHLNGTRDFSNISQHRKMK